MSSSNLSELQRVQIEMLNKFVGVCEKNNLKYWLGDGSLLGGVRHKGFIPWDDDIDVLMPYEDYKLFTEIAQMELGDEYFLQTSLTDRNWYRVYGTLRKKNTAMIQNDRYHVNQGVWLDIFIIGNARNEFECKVQKFIITAMNYVLMDEYMKINEGEFSEKLTPVGYFLFQTFYKIPWKFRYHIRQLILDKVCKNKGGKYYPEIWCAITDVYAADCFEGAPQKVLFENKKYDAPHNPDLFLRTQYGDDYMTPIKWERGHEKILIDLQNSYEKYLK